MMEYDRYLRLPELLAIQSPLTSDSDRRRWDAERFFIVVHQSCELLLLQVVTDLTAATSALSDGGEIADCLERLERVSACLAALTQHTNLLNTLPLDCFVSFRPGLGSASGAQSKQFDTVRRLLGVAGDGRPSLLFDRFLSLLSREGLSLTQLLGDDRHRGRELRRVADALAGVAHAYRCWQSSHIEIVLSMVGDAAGTGGTSGVPYLEATMRAPFPGLWHARADLHRSARSNVNHS